MCVTATITETWKMLPSFCFLYLHASEQNKTYRLQKKGNEVTEIKRARVEESVSIVDCYDKYCSM